MGAQTVCANITSTGTIIAQTLNVQQVTSSIVYSSGSNTFGNQLTDVQQFTGSLRVTGSGNHFIVGGNFGVGTSSPNTKFEIGEEASPILRITSTSGPYSQIQSNTVGTLQLMADEGNTGANTSMRFRIDGFEAMRFTSSGSACFACQTCAPGMDIMPSGIGVSTLGGIMRVVTTGTSTGIAVGQSNSNRYTHFAANDIQVFNDDFFLTTRCAFPLSIGTCYTARLTFAATGIACFSCQVCAPQGIFINGAASLQAQFGQNNDATGTQTSAIDIISRNAANTAGFTFRIQNCATTCTTHLVYGGNTVMAFRCDGNVGIGTTTPFAKLEVVGGNNLPPSTGTQNYTVALRDPTSMVVDVGGSILLQGFKTSNTAIGNFAYIAGKKENGTAGNEAGYLSLGTFDSSGIPAERMRITSGGNMLLQSGAVIGLNTSDGSDNGYLAIAGASGDGSARGGHIYLSGNERSVDAGNVVIAAGDSASGTGSPGTILFRTCASVERMRITGAGNVGIGTNNPVSYGSRTLDVNAASGLASYIVARANNNTETVELAIDGGSGYLSTKSAHPLRIRTQDVTRILITHDGYISLNSVVFGTTTAGTTRTLYIGENAGLYYIGGISSIRESKKNINPISNVDWLYNLNPVTFNYRKKDAEGNFTDEFYDEVNYGLIAEETSCVADFLVNYDQNNDGTKKMLGIEYPRLIVPLLKAIQEQQCKINILESCLGIN